MHCYVRKEGRMYRAISVRSAWGMAGILFNIYPIRYFDVSFVEKKMP